MPILLHTTKTHFVILEYTRLYLNGIGKETSRIYKILIYNKATISNLIPPAIMVINSPNDTCGNCEILKA